MPNTNTLTPSERVLQVSVSPMFAALLDCVLGNPAPRTSPRITALAITSDGFLMAWNTSRPDKEGMLGRADDLERNIIGVCKAAELTDEETKDVLAAAMSKIHDWRA